MNTARRQAVVSWLACATSGWAGITVTTAASAAKLEESDAVATSLGYRESTAKVDEKKYPKHASTQTCGNCQLYQGTAKDAVGGCPLFAGKQVTSGGWCSAWVKKAD